MMADRDDHEANDRGAARSGGSDDGTTRMGRLRYLLALSRPRFWFYLAGPVVVGVVFAAETVPELFVPRNVALFAYFLLPANVLLYGINDRFDADIDVENPKKEGRETRWGGDRVALVAVALSGLLGLGLFALVPLVAWPWLGLFFVLVVEYSAPPLRLKTTPVLDSVSNGLYILPGVVAYTTLDGTLPPVTAIAGAWIWTMGMHTFSAIPDIGPDRAAGIRTTATVLGEGLTLGYCFLVWTVAAVAFSLLDVRLGLLLGVYPVFVGAVVGTDLSVDRAYWWFPALNTAVGTALTIGRLWQIVPPSEVLP